MKHKLLLLTMLFAAFLAAACQPAAEALPTTSPTPTEDLVALAANFTPIPTIALATATTPPTDIPTITVAPIQATDTPLPPTDMPTRVTSMPSETPLPTNTPVLEQVDHYWLSRPIAQEEGLVHWLDRTYPYGGTQFGTREVHLGVEFVNQRFTPVYAAGDGTVLFAGEDSAIQFGPERDYYGNVVVIEHSQLSPEGLPLYTLYAHLQDIRVQAGQPILAGERVGRVGDTGIAVGPHLHFEVRVGDVYDYHSTR
ncbi:MAG: M23 family metallopeptidase, partial [Anaerolineae bacterium]|nr:M23 family metallopeptidase [Anaerolineae bacterium]